MWALACISMDIEKLKNKRQLNVQEQNALVKHGIASEAKFWRKHGVPTPLRKALEVKGIDIETSIFLDYEQDFPGLSTDEGTILTQDKEFFRFEIDLNKDRTKLIDFYLWENITTTVEVKKNKTGTGSTSGYLSLKVLSELNKC